MGGRRCKNDPSAGIDCVPLTATGEALIRLDGHSVSHVDRALGGKGTFTIDATWGRAGFSIHNNETSIGLFERNAPLAKSRIHPPVHPHLDVT